MKDVRECERKIEEAVDSLKTITKSSGDILIQRFLAVSKLNSHTLYMDIQDNFDFKIVLDAFSNAINKVNTALKYAAHAPIKFSYINTSTDGLSYAEINQILQGFLNVLLIYIHVLSKAKIAHSTQRYNGLFINSDPEVTSLDNAYREEDYLERIRKAFNFIGKIKVESIFSD